MKQPAMLYIAVTSRDLDSTPSLLETLRGLPVGIKVGLELFVRMVPGLPETISRAGFPLFLDLKFHDIPHTVAGAVSSACRFRPELINVHASGGIEMMKAAADAARGKTKVLAVTILTSLSQEDLELSGFTGTPAVLVRGMAAAAMKAGLDGVVCSPDEASIVRETTAPDFLVVTPGIRPAGSSPGDQKRFATPHAAILRGATSLVVGRPVTQSPDPYAAASSILEEIDKALSSLPVSLT